MSAKGSTFDVWVRREEFHFVGWVRHRAAIADLEDAQWMVGRLAEEGKNATVTETGKEPL